MPDQGHPVERLLAAVDMVPAEREYARNNNNNNNNQITLVQLRNRLFQVLLYRMSIFYAGCFPGKARKVIEIGILIQAVVCFMVLIYVHMAFVRTPVTCLQKEVDTWSRQGVLRVEISLDEQKTKPFNISEFYTQNSYALAGHLARVRQEQKEYFERMRRQRAERKKKPQVKFPELKITKKIFRKEKDFEKREILDAEKRPVFVNRTLPFTDSVFDPDCFSPSKTLLSETELFTNTVWHHEKYIIEYSLEYGFLRLSPSARINTTVKVHTVILEPFKDQCFGNQFSRFLLKHVLGYSDILMGSLRYLVDQIVDHDDPKKGYVRNVVTGEYYRFSDKIMDWSSYVYAGVFMIAFTLAVSILLRYSHHQIFVFVVELMHIFEMQSFHVPAAPLITIVLALVGMEALMSEFFNDSVTAFYVIIVVWIADQFDSVCCRSNASKKHWLKLFYLYHFGFYAYHNRFNGQYSFLAFGTSWLFIQHSMFYFFHRYELPTILAANDNEIEYDSDESYNADNYALVSDGSVIDEDEDDYEDDDDFQYLDYSSFSQESDSQDGCPVESSISTNDSSNTTENENIKNENAKNKEVNGGVENNKNATS